MLGRGVKAVRQGWGRIGRLLVCGLLLLWICHAIFSGEAQAALHASDQAWSSMSRLERWRAAWTIGPVQLWHTLGLVHPAGLGLSFVFMGATILLGAWRWRTVLKVQGLDLDFRRTLEISLIAQFFNAFFLGSTGGDLMKAYYAARETRHKKTEAVVTVLADRLIGLVAMLLFAGLMMLVNFRFLLGHTELAVLVGLLVAMLLGGCIILALALWSGLSRALPSARSWLRKLPKADLLEQALEAFRTFGRDIGFLRLAFGISVLLNVACVGQLMALGMGLGMQVPTTVWLVIVPTIICASALPITPSGLGVRENLYVLALAGSALQVPATHALALSLLAYVGFLVWSVIGGIVYLLARESLHLDEVTRPNES
jgi:uncharacterized protein (TIRG00374 family)